MVERESGTGGFIWIQVWRGEVCFLGSAMIDDFRRVKDFSKKALEEICETAKKRPHMLGRYSLNF